MMKYTYPIDKYRQKAILMLKNFCVRITPEIEAEINSRDNEISIDNYCNGLIKGYFVEKIGY